MIPRVFFLNSKLYWLLIVLVLNYFTTLCLGVLGDCKKKYYIFVFNIELIQKHLVKIEEILSFLSSFSFFMCSKIDENILPNLCTYYQILVRILCFYYSKFALELISNSVLPNSTYENFFLHNNAYQNYVI